MTDNSDLLSMNSISADESNKENGQGTVKKVGSEKQADEVRKEQSSSKLNRMERFYRMKIKAELSDSSTANTASTANSAPNIEESATRSSDSPVGKKPKVQQNCVKTEVKSEPNDDVIVLREKRGPVRGRERANASAVHTTAEPRTTSRGRILGPALISEDLGGLEDPFYEDLDKNEAFDPTYVPPTD